MKQFITIVFTAIVFLISCEKENQEDVPDVVIPDTSGIYIPTAVTDSFESGNIGVINRINDTVWNLYIGDDNDDHSLPASFRAWWSIRMDHVKKGAELEVSVQNSGWPYFYIPVYGSTPKEYQRFAVAETNQYPGNRIVVNKKFEDSTVYMSMFYPYTLSDLEDYLQQINGNPFVNIEIAGYSQQGRPLYLLKISDFSVLQTNKKRVFIHARTHPAEIPASFVIEGLINHLISGNAETAAILSGFEFYIIPMQNVDGVVVGNYRTTPNSENLELMWYYDSSDPINLLANSPVEVEIVHQIAKQLMTDGGPPVTMALNLHASASEPDIRPFFFPHFGPEYLGYSSEESSLWDKQLHFIEKVGEHYGENMLEPLPMEGGGSFAGKTYPESWWWVNFRDQVMAITMEMTYGRAGYAPHWVNPDNLRNLGKSLSLAIRDYHSAPVLRHKKSNVTNWENRINELEFPHLYPPAAKDEMKE